MLPRPARIATAAVLLALAGCGKHDDGPAPVEPQVDPVVARAVNAPLMSDPDLASQNRGDSAISAGEPPVTEIPPDKRTREEADAARGEALGMAGSLADPPRPVGSDATSPARSAGSPAALARIQLGVSAPCAASLSYGAIWAARTPQSLPVYPRAHLLDGAGADGKECTVRVLRFITPVEPRDVIAFYNAMAHQDAYRIERRSAGGDDVLAGRKAGARFVVWARRRADGMTEADLAISGANGTAG